MKLNAIVVGDLDAAGSSMAGPLARQVLQSVVAIMSDTHLSKAGSHDASSNPDQDSREL